MTDKIFDDFMRDKLRNHASPVPAGLWEKIEKEQKRRPVGFFWSNRILTMGLLLAIVATIGGLIWWKSSNNVQQTVSVAKENTINNQEQANNKQTITSNQEENHNTKATRNNAIAGNIDATVHNNTNTPTQQLSKADITAKKRLVKKNNIPVEKEQVEANGNQQPSTANELLIAANRKRSTNSSSTTKTIVGAEQESTENNNQSGFEENERIVLYSYNPSSHRRKGLLAAIDKKAYSFSDKSMPQLKASMPFTVDCPSTNGNARNDWYVEMYASPDYTFKTVKGGTASSAYLQKKDSTESMRVGYTAGFRITKNIGQHLLLKAGLQLSQINERFTLRTENERKTTTVTTTRDIIDASGNVTTVTETSTYTQIGYLERVSNNQYRSIELPIMLGYEFGNDKLKASINGGIIANLASWYKGKTLDTAYQSISLAKSSDGSVYNHSVGIGLYGSISIIKPINEKLNVFAEPYFRYSLSHLNSSSLGYTQRFSTAGISLGIRYRFNNNPTKQHY
jgi:opacity protein-like surface antigen